MNKLQTQLSTIFLNVEADLGTTGLLYLILEVAAKTAEDFKGDNIDDFFDQFKDLLLMIKETKPRIGVVIHYFSEIWEKLMESKPGFRSMSDVSKALRNYCEDALLEAENDVCKLINHGATFVENGDSILVHSHSKVVLRVLEKALNDNKKFRVIVAEQEKDKTNDILNFLQEKGIPFYVVPEFMLSHIENEVTKVFLGAVTLNDSHNFVTNAGTNSVVSEFHHEHIPIYVFLITKKFSLWEAGKVQHTFKFVETKMDKSAKKSFTYERIKFSHDRIPLTVLDHIVTENGLFTPKQIGEIYDKMLNERNDWRKKHLTCPI